MAAHRAAAKQVTRIGGLFYYSRVIDSAQIKKKERGPHSGFVSPSARGFFSTPHLLTRTLPPIIPIYLTFSQSLSICCFSPYDLSLLPLISLAVSLAPSSPSTSHSFSMRYSCDPPAAWCFALARLKGGSVLLLVCAVHGPYS